MKITRIIYRVYNDNICDFVGYINFFNYKNPGYNILLKIIANNNNINNFFLLIY